ncbi:MAG TPA: PH domain-containing protein [Pyrinomonadaceae bacterium]|nr:PH domain-containing protein [Pyrinomonadaceae bacterium]
MGDEEETHVRQAKLTPGPPAGVRGTDSSPAGEIERVVFTLRPTFLFIGVGYMATALCSILLVMLLAYAGLGAGPSLLLALLPLFLPAYCHLRRNVVRYTLTDSQVEIDRGFFLRTTRHIPLRNIQDVTVSASLFKRLAGIGDVIIENASEGGGLTLLHNIHRPRRYADLLLRELRRRP